jgi:predicted unusual protein kinase regulating ubiquinone biosynthesis (AarF/ABC1/UbiB family)
LWREVAVKVQRPGLRRQCSRDLVVMGHAAKVVQVLFLDNTRMLTLVVMVTPTKLRRYK